MIEKPPIGEPQFHLTIRYQDGDALRVAPFHVEGGEMFLTGKQLVQAPALAAWVEAHKDQFRLAHDRDIYIWEPKSDG